MLLLFLYIYKRFHKSERLKNTASLASSTLAKAILYVNNFKVAVLTGSKGDLVKYKEQFYSRKKWSSVKDFFDESDYIRMLTYCNIVYKK